MGPETRSHQPDEMACFSLLEPAPPVLAPRLGRLAVAGRTPLRTPHYVAITSRGAVSHVSHDVMRDHTSISSLYIGLEDCTCCSLISVDLTIVKPVVSVLSMPASSNDIRSPGPAQS